MSWCPHCDIPYDEDNETQPCCGGCGHPYTCSCLLGHLSARERQEIRAHNLCVSFCALLADEIIREQDWIVEEDHLLEFKNNYGTMTTKRRLVIYDKAAFPEVRLHVTFFKTGKYLPQGKGIDSRMGVKVKELLAAAEKLANHFPTNIPLPIQVWPWQDR